MLCSTDNRFPESVPYAPGWPKAPDTGSNRHTSFAQVVEHMGDSVAAVSDSLPPFPCCRHTPPPACVWTQGDACVSLFAGGVPRVSREAPRADSAPGCGGHRRRFTGSPSSSVSTLSSEAPQSPCAPSFPARTWPAADAPGRVLQGPPPTAVTGSHQLRGP